MPIRKDWLEFKAENIDKLPEKDGVYELGDAQQNVVFIRGTPNLRQSLQENLQDTEPGLQKVGLFRYEETFMYTLRESELIQQYMRQSKKLPPLNEEII